MILVKEPREWLVGDLNLSWFSLTLSWFSLTVYAAACIDNAKPWLCRRMIVKSLSRFEAGLEEKDAPIQVADLEREMWFPRLGSGSGRAKLV